MMGSIGTRLHGVARQSETLVLLGLKSRLRFEFFMFGIIEKYKGSSY